MTQQITPSDSQLQFMCNRISPLIAFPGFKCAHFPIGTDERDYLPTLTTRDDDDDDDDVPRLGHGGSRQGVLERKQ